MVQTVNPMDRERLLGLGSADQDQVPEKSKGKRKKKRKPNIHSNTDDKETSEVSTPVAQAPQAETDVDEAKG